MTAHAIVLPAIHPETTAAFVDRLDPEIARSRLIVIDNTDDGVISDITAGRVLDGHRSGGNLGVGASWNLGARMAFGHAATFVTLASASVELTDGGHALCRTADLAAENSQWPYGFESMNGWHLITFSARLFEEVGWFDEKFYPGYMEDTDMIRRMRLAGVLEPAGGDRALRQIPWIGALKYPDQQAHAIKGCDIHIDFVELAAYYASKWGGPPGEETFEHPFGGSA